MLKAMNKAKCSMLKVMIEPTWSMFKGRHLLN